LPRAKTLTIRETLGYSNLQAIEEIKKSKFEDIKSSTLCISQSAKYLVIYESGKSILNTTISSFWTDDYKYIFVVGDYGYIIGQGYSKYDFELIAIASKENIITEIKGKNWTIKRIDFGFARYGYQAPSLVIALNEHENCSINYAASSLTDFEDAWRFFIELDDNCTTLESAEHFKNYYQEKLETKNQTYTLNQYTKEIQEKNSIINQYKDLLKLIEDKLNVSIAKL
jgi:hypothetical protein